jgi:hypothetical protein
VDRVEKNKMREQKKKKSEGQPWPHTAFSWDITFNPREPTFSLVSPDSPSSDRQ